MLGIFILPHGFQSKSAVEYVCIKEKLIITEISFAASCCLCYESVSCVCIVSAFQHWEARSKLIWRLQRLSKERVRTCVQRKNDTCGKIVDVWVTTKSFLALISKWEPLCNMHDCCHLCHATGTLAVSPRDLHSSVSCSTDWPRWLPDHSPPHPWCPLPISFAASIETFYQTGIFMYDVHLEVIYLFLMLCNNALVVYFG